jgi:hypothetical protein
MWDSGLLAGLIWGIGTAWLLPAQYFAVHPSGTRDASLTLRLAVPAFVGAAGIACIVVRGRLRCARTARAWGAIWCITGAVSCFGAVVLALAADTFRLVPEHALGDVLGGDLVGIVVVGPVALIEGFVLGLATLPAVLLLRRKLC